MDRRRFIKGAVAAGVSLGLPVTAGLAEEIFKYGTVQVDFINDQWDRCWYTVKGSKLNDGAPVGTFDPSKVSGYRCALSGSMEPETDYVVSWYQSRKDADTLPDGRPNAVMADDIWYPRCEGPAPTNYMVKRRKKLGLHEQLDKDLDEMRQRAANKNL